MTNQVAQEGMMITRTIVFNDFTPPELADVVGRWDGQNQADFFDDLAGVFERFNSIQHGDKDGMQMLYIEEHLTERARAFLAKLCEYTRKRSDSE